jgi:hypothetical protein
MFCWPCILIISVMITNLVHCLSLIYFVTQPLNETGICCPSSGAIHCICTAIATCYTLFFFFSFFYWAPVASAPESTAVWRLIVRVRLWKFPLVPQGAPTPTTRDTFRQGKLWARNVQLILPSNSEFHAIWRDFYMPQICDMGLAALLPLWRKACWGFFTLKNPTDSVGFEPANLGTRGQHANP